MEIAVTSQMNHLVTNQEGRMHHPLGHPCRRAQYIQISSTSYLMLQYEDHNSNKGALC